MGREDQPAQNPWEIAAELGKGRNVGICLYPESNGSSCGINAIGSHTVAKRMLRQIADDGHVYQCNKTLRDALSSRGTVPWQRVGVNKASATPIFCAKHDSELFVPLEQQDFMGTPQQCFLLAYRALCYELFAKQIAFANLAILRKLDVGKPVWAQMHAQREIDDYETGVKAALTDATNEKERFDAVLRLNDWSQVRAFIIFFREVPEVLCSTAICPDYDFFGREVQSLEDLSATLDLLTVSLVPAGAGGAFVFSWLNTSDGVSRLVAESLAKLDDTQIAHAVFRFVFEFCENHYIKPLWWDALAEPLRLSIGKRMSASVNDFRSPSCLSDDGLRVVDWHVAERRWI